MGVDHKRTYRLCMKCFHMLTIPDMTTVHIFGVLSGKFNVVKV